MKWVLLTIIGVCALSIDPEVYQWVWWLLADFHPGYYGK